MRVLTSISGHNLRDVGKFARQLEGNGFSGATTQENRSDAFLPLAVAATETDRLQLRTSISIAFARSPMSSAMMAWDIQAASNGRFTLGLGSQVKGHNVRRFSVPWSPPAPRIREYVQSVRAIWDCWQNDAKLDYQGEHYQFTLMTPNFTPEKLTCALPRIEIAAVGPVMMKVAAEECDGVMLHGFCTKKYLEDAVMPRLQGGLKTAGKSREDFEISGGGFVATGPDDEAVQELFEWVRMRVGFYGSTPSYWPVFEAHGLEDLGHKLNDMSKKGQWDAMTREISDDVVRLFTAVGRHDELVGAIEDRFGGLADIVGLPADTPPDVVQDVKAINCPFRS
ncbi:MAG: TIGR03617 family F420-dependent LLM class oxidoreductase [Gammaproteobacteria bacterium]|nr:TIGR03617 family F420-dependent LLM class oxidoreductase [Gammaproteobacteria bacterium]